VISEGAVIENSIIGLRSKIGRNARISNSILMGADSYQSSDELADERRGGIPPIGIGDDAVLQGVILDKNCRIGRGVRIMNTKPLANAHPNVVMVDGIIVVAKETTLPDGWRS
jgi:glucose-1-phosphate adenylyltransferase